jgi:hypothetical protein
VITALKNNSCVVLVTSAKSFFVMPNQHSTDKEVIGFYIPRTLAARVRKAAKSRGLTITAFIEETLTHATRKTILAPEDYLAIAEATKRAAGRLASKRVSRQSKN